MPTTALSASRAAAALAVATTAVLVLGGCGSPAAYKREATRACLAKKGLRFRPLGPRVDFVASTALGGALSVRTGANEVTLAFGENAKQAEGIAGAYRRFGARYVASVLRVDRNVVLVWATPPSDRDTRTVGRCLRS